MNVKTLGLTRDIQKENNHPNIPINKVGVKNIKYPIVVRDRENKEQHTVANINMYVDLPKYYKGTHMSRFIEVLNQYRGKITRNGIRKILQEMREKLEAETAHLEIEFSYFIEKEAPVSKSKSLMEYRCQFLASNNDGEDFILIVKVPVTSLCPCSKEISNHGAHNQRSEVIIKIRSKEFVWIEDLISLAESSASSEVYSLLKREDEKYVTERAYDNPVFVEDMVRKIAEKLEADPNIIWFSVESESFESIHNHSAYAFIEAYKPKGFENPVDHPSSNNA